MFATEGDHFLDARNSETGFERAWFVIEPAMKDAAVVSALMRAEAVFLLQQGELGSREPFRYFESGGQTQKSAANDDDFFYSQSRDDFKFRDKYWRCARPGSSA